MTCSGKFSNFVFAKQIKLFQAGSPQCCRLGAKFESASETISPPLPLNIWPCTPCIIVCSVWWSSGHHVILMLGLTSGCVPRQLPVLPVNEDGHVDFT